jgi:RNA polymerase sigma factor (sigma-70 family)
MTRADLEDVWRREAPHVLGALVRRYADFDGCEDAVQEALVAAAVQWPREGMPDHPRGWLVRVASRRMVDALRSDRSRADREEVVATREPADAAYAPAADADLPPYADDTLQLLVLCCHPALTLPSRVALTLRAVGGLTTAQIAAAFLVPEATMAQRISRAKATLRSAGARFAEPSAEERPERIAAVRHVLYLVFNEGYATSSGDRLVDVSLTREAIRLVRELRERVPGDAEVAGLLALMLLTDARAAARTDSRGDLVPLEHQDRSRWDPAAIREGVAILEQVLPHERVGLFQLQAAIAAVHADAPTWADTDWLQITILYRLLDRAAPSPTVSLNLAVAVGMAHGAEAGLAVVEPLRHTAGMERHHRLHAVRAHLLEAAGRPSEALEAYAGAARLTTSLPEQRYLNGRAAGLVGTGASGSPSPPVPR